MINIIEYSKKAHSAAKAKGWWDEIKPMETYLLLIVSELTECMEADRKGKHANVEYFTKRTAEIEESAGNVDFDLTFWSGVRQTKEEYLSKMFAEKFKAHIKDSVEDELADVIIRVFDLVGYLCEGSGNPSEHYEHVQYRFKVSQPMICTVFKDFPLSVQLFKVVRALESEDLFRLAMILRELFEIANFYNINIVWHIEQKMRYNETRTHKHGGKKY